MEAAEVCSGGSTVPAAVVIVVKHRACLSVGQLIVGVQARSFVVIAGIAALSFVDGMWQYGASVGVSSVGRSARSLVGLCSYAYRHEACRGVGSQAYRREILL